MCHGQILASELGSGMAGLWQRERSRERRAGFVPNEFVSSVSIPWDFFSQPCWGAMAVTRCEAQSQCHRCCLSLLLGRTGPLPSERRPMAKWEKEQSQMKMHLPLCPPSHVSRRAACGHGWVQLIHQELGAGTGPQLLQD